MLPAVSHGCFIQSGFAKDDYIIHFRPTGQLPGFKSVADPTETPFPLPQYHRVIFPTGGLWVGSRRIKLRQMRYRISNNILQSSTDLGVTWQDVVNQY